MSQHEFEKKFENLKVAIEENSSVVVKYSVLSTSVKAADSFIHISYDDQCF